MCKLSNEPCQLILQPVRNTPNLYTVVCNRCKQSTPAMSLEAAEVFLQSVQHRADCKLSGEDKSSMQ